MEPQFANPIHVKTEHYALSYYSPERNVQVSFNADDMFIDDVLSRMADFLKGCGFELAGLEIVHTHEECI